ncbi:hypothetical protein MKX01_001780 [Papaver californicum]|nr:hypothetical protein MKX01_001780 [Papaver californicum]
MAKLSTIFYFILVLFVEGKTCTIAWGPCPSKWRCNHECYSHYQGEGFCNFIAGTRQKQCLCSYPCL